MSKRPDARTVILWDGKSWRKGIDAEYKAQRTKTAKQRADREEYKSQSDHIKRAFTLLGIGQLIAGNMEADDLAGILARRFAAQGHLVRLVTRDKDWLQLVGKGVTWYDHSSSQIVSGRNFEEVAGYDDVERFVQHKALTGDASDNIKGVGGVGDKAAGTLLSIWPTVDAFLVDADFEAVWCAETGAKTCPKAIREFADTRVEKFRYNMMLMDLRKEPPVPIERMRPTSGQFDKEGFRRFCLEFGFHSILDDFDRFIQPFEDHQLSLNTED